VRSATLRQMWRWVRLGGGLLIIAVVVHRLGAAPFLDGVRRVDATSLLAALVITGATTVVSAWRWRLIARGLGVRIPLASAVASYYRSQFLNSTLPGGVVGDVHRGVRHGQQVDDVSRGLRSVGWDRAAGQVVQFVVAGLTLLVFASPVRPKAAVIGWIVVSAVGVVALAGLAVSGGGPSWLERLARAVRGDVRAVLPDRGVTTAIVVASVLVVAGHVGVFLVAARAAGTPASTSSLLPLAMLVLLAMTVPLSVGGWGPREGIAAWAFAVAGLGAAKGVETATVYGVLSLVATLPGAVVLLLSWRPQHRPRAATRAEDPPAMALVAAGSGRRSDG
jgi:glycosyltransferase 2 family protein